MKNKRNKQYKATNTDDKKVSNIQKSKQIFMKKRKKYG